jgi:hypothetical protein
MLYTSKQDAASELWMDYSYELVAKTLDLVLFYVDLRISTSRRSAYPIALWCIASLRNLQSMEERLLLAVFVGTG